LYRPAPGSPQEVDIRSINRHAERCEAYKKQQQSLPGKKYNPNPNYVSPYTKEVMQSDIPLKAVLNKAAKLRNSPRKKRKGNNTRRNNRSRSRSKTRSRSRRSRPPNRLQAISLIDSGDAREFNMAQNVQAQSPNGQKLKKSMNTTAATNLTEDLSQMPIRKLDRHLKARRQKLDPKYFAEQQERKNRSKSRKKVMDAMYPHRLSPSRNDKFKKNIGIAT
jgi:hypothetical protein